MVHFHIEYLCQQTTVRKILTELGRLKISSTNNSSPLMPTYNRAMEIIRVQPKNCTELAFNILSWLIKAQRTLTVHELQLAVSVEHDWPTFDDQDLPDRKTLLDVCASLVIIDESSDTIKLTHYTVQEYLLKNSIIPGSAGPKLAIACTTFLSFDIFAQGACTSYSALEARLKLYPFLGYAAQYLCYHLTTCNDETSTTEPAPRFLASPGNTSSYLQAYETIKLNPLHGPKFSWYPKGQNPLHIAAP